VGPRAPRLPRPEARLPLRRGGQGRPSKLMSGSSSLIASDD
jgi:hypothetical protein